MGRRKDDRLLRQVIRDHLNQHGLSQREFGAKVGVDQSRVSVWIRGNEVPRADNIPALAKELGMDEDDLAALVNRSRKPQVLGPSTYAERLGEIEKQVDQHDRTLTASTEAIEQVTKDIAELRGMVEALTKALRDR